MNIDITKTDRTNTKTANTDIRRGTTILALGAILFGATAEAPANADGRFRDHGRAVVDIRLDVGSVNGDFVFYSGPDHRPAGLFWVYDSHGHCWRRDRCR